MANPPFAADHEPIVLAFGGNALLPDPFHPEDQERHARDLAQALILLLARSAGLVLVHGNGPQVGMILLRVEATRDMLPSEPLDVLVAETQGSIGYLLSRSLRDALTAEGSRLEVTTILTQVVVEADDPAFDRPDKPIGPFYSHGQAVRLQDERGWRMVEVVGSGWRRVVASPRPREVIEGASISAAARAGHVVIAGGGGGVPVRREADGRLVGVEAVIDKDRTAALLARELHAGSLVILTGVPHVSLGHGTSDERPIDSVTCAAARELLLAGEFPPGSMGPKIEAAVAYVSSEGRPALITDTARLPEALAGRAGTWIQP